jgi:hypothetical protein
MKTLRLSGFLWSGSLVLRRTGLRPARNVSPCGAAHMNSSGGL